MTSFQTKNGREVFDGGGINPDIITKYGNYSNIIISSFKGAFISLIMLLISDLNMTASQKILFSQIAI